MPRKENWSSADLVSSRTRKVIGVVVIIVGSLFLVDMLVGAPSLIEHSQTKYPGGVGLYLALGILVGFPSLAVYGGYRYLRGPKEPKPATERRKKWDAISSFAIGITVITVQLILIFAPPKYTKTGPELVVLTIIGMGMGAYCIITGIYKLKRIKAVSAGKNGL